MELALTTLLLLPGVVSLAIATGPGSRTIAPRDLPTALIAIVAFALVNFCAAALLYKIFCGAPNLGSSIAVLLTGDAHDGLTREAVIAGFFELSVPNAGRFVFLGLATLGTGLGGERLYLRLLQIIARREFANIIAGDDRTRVGKFCDAWLESLGLAQAALARGASYWLIVEQAAKLLALEEPEVYADITQGEDATLFAGQVVQVITSRSGETLSVVLKKAQRYRRNVYGEFDPKTGQRPVVQKASWQKIGDSEAFYLRGDCIRNISYRIYGDPARGGYKREKRDGSDWSVDNIILDIMRHVAGPLGKGSTDTSVARQEKPFVRRYKKRRK